MNGTPAISKVPISKVLLVAGALLLDACQPAGPGPEILGRQRDAMQQANQLEQQMQQQLDTRMQEADTVRK